MHSTRTAHRFHKNPLMRTNPTPAINRRHSERGAALATALIIMSLLSAVSMTVLAVVTHEARIAGSDLQRTQTFYAAAAGIEKMTNDFSNAFAKSSNPDLSAIPNGYPSELTTEGFTFNQKLDLDNSAR